MQSLAAITALFALLHTGSANPVATAGSVCGGQKTCKDVIEHNPSGLQDCSSFLLTTIVPSLVTKIATGENTFTYPTYVSTTTVTITPSGLGTIYGPATRVTPSGTYYHHSTSFTTTTTTAAVTAVKRALTGATTITPTQIPAYATGECSSPDIYSKACRKEGVKNSETTLATPTTTYTYFQDTFVYAPATLTIDRTATATSTVTVARGTGLPCDVAQDRDSGNPKVYCGMNLASPGPLLFTNFGGDEYACLQVCDRTPNCFAGVYDWQYNSCSGYEFRGEMGNAQSADTDIVIPHDF